MPEEDRSAQRPKYCDDKSKDEDFNKELKVTNSAVVKRKMYILLHYNARIQISQISKLFLFPTY